MASPAQRNIYCISVSLCTDLDTVFYTYRDDSLFCNLNIKCLEAVLLRYYEQMCFAILKSCEVSVTKVSLLVFKNVNI